MSIWGVENKGANYVTRRKRELILIKSFLKEERFPFSWEEAVDGVGVRRHLLAELVGKAAIQWWTRTGLRLGPTNQTFCCVLNLTWWPHWCCCKIQQETLNYIKSMWLSEGWAIWISEMHPQIKTIYSGIPHMRRLTSHGGTAVALMIHLDSCHNAIQFITITIS